MILVTGLMKYLLVSVFTFCILFFKNFKINITKQTGHIIILYLLYILFEYISLIIENPANEIIFTNILPRHYGCMLILLNLSLLDNRNFNYVLHLFFIFTALSCLMSILQFFQFDFALDLYRILYPSNISYTEMEFSNIVKNNFSFYGYPGLFENIVLSAQYSSTFLMFSFFYFKNNKLLRLFFFLIFFTAILSMQVRSGVYSILVVLTGFTFFFYRKYFIIIITPLLIYSIIIIKSFIETINLRILDPTSPIREIVNENFWSYVSEGNFFGKREYFANRNYFLKKQDITTPHHIIKNAYVLAGYPGLLVTLIIIIKIIFYRLRKSLSFKDDYIFKAALFCYLVSAFTHNNSFHFGYPLMFIILLFHEKN